MANGLTIGGKGLDEALDFNKAASLASIPLAASGVGAGFGAGLTIIGGINDLYTAKAQREQALKLKDKANALMPNPIQQEYYQKLKQDQLLGLSGKPGLNTAEEMIGSNTANAVRLSTEMSPSGAAALASLGAVVTSENMAINDLRMEDADYRAEMEQQVGQDLLTIGEKKREMEIERNVRRDEMLNQAADFQNKATYNKSAATKSILGAVSSSIPTFTKLGAEGVALNESKITGADLTGQEYKALNEAIASGVADGTLSPNQLKKYKKLIRQYDNGY